MLGLNRPMRDRRRSSWLSGGLWQIDGRDVVVEGMPWRTAGKSARYAGELIVPDPLDVVR